MASNPHRNILYVVGAGASCALDQRVPGLTNSLGFIRTNFLREWESSKQDWQHLNVYTVGSDVILRGPNLKHDPMDLEAVMQYFYENSGSPNGEVAEIASRSYKRLTDLICRMLAKLDADIISKLTIETNPYMDLAERIRGCRGNFTHHFISFNYELWLEQALQRAGLWNPANGYIINKSNPIQIMFKGPGKIGRLPSSEVPKCVIYKPHGSLSWFIPNRDFHKIPLVSVDSDDVVQQKWTKGAVNYLAVDGEYHFELSEGESVSGKYTPLIIPPIEDKGIPGRFLHGVYRDMYSCISDAHIVVVVGWSIPRTDVFIRATISDAMAPSKRRPLERLVVCDKNKTDVFYDRFGATFPADSFTQFKDGFSRQFNESVLERLWADQLPM